MNTEERYLKTMSYPKHIKRDRIVHKPKYGAADTSLLFIVIFLLIIGIMTIFSAAAPKCITSGLGQFDFVIKQSEMILVGLVVMFGLTRWDYKKLEPLALPFAWFVIGLLLLVLMCGVTVNGATRWIAIGSIQFQPSEMAKPAVALLLACAFKDNTLITNDKIVKYFLPILIMIGLIYKQPNLSMIIILALLCVQIYFIAGGSIKLLFAGGIVGALGVMFSLKHSAYQMQRVTSWLHPELDPYGKGYNIIQSIMAFVAGGFYGTGYGNSRQKLGWLPEAHTDFIFPVFAEEFGFLGCLLVIGLFLVFLQRGLMIAKKCPNQFGKLLASGITLVICTQAAINIAVSSSMIPATGVPLPFVSYGGTSVVISLGMIGVLLNISRKRTRTIKTNERF